MRSISKTPLILCIFILANTACSTPKPAGKLYYGWKEPSTQLISNQHITNPNKLRPNIIAFTLDFEQEFPKETCKTLLENQHIPMIIWEPWVWQSQYTILIKHILRGEWDDYIIRWAKDAKKLQYPVLIQFAPHFNTADYPWSIGHEKQSAADYKKLYQYVHTLFKQEGAVNVLWVWAPKITENNPMPEAAYPGDTYINWIAINTDDISIVLQHPYTLSKKPVMLELHPDQHIEITDATLNKLPELKAVLTTDVPKAFWSQQFARPIFNSATETLNQVQ